MSDSDKPFDIDFWSRQLGDLQRTHDEPDTNDHIQVERAMRRQARAWIEQLASQLRDDQRELTPEIAALYARAHRATETLVRLLDVTNREDTFDVRDPNEWEADLDAAMLLFQHQLMSKIFRIPRGTELPLDVYRGYGQILLVGIRLGRKWQEGL